MGRWKTTAGAVLALGGVGVLASAAAADTGTGSVTGPILIPAAGTEGPASAYPSTITLTGVAGTVESVEVTFDNFSHTFPSDLMIVLQAPNGGTTVLSGYCGGSSDAVDVDLVFVAGATTLPASALTSGTFAPTQCFEPFDLAAPAPAGPYGTGFGAMFGGTPNGDWRLWIEDQAGADAGDLEGWSLRVTTNSAPVTTNGSFATTPGTPVSGSLASLTTDAEGDPLTYAATTPAHGTVTVDPATGAFTYTPAVGFVGTDSFTFTADDSVVAPTDPAPPTTLPEEQFEPAAVSAPATVTITVAQVQATTSTTAPTTATTARAALARTGIDRGATAGSGVLSIVLGLGLVGASGALVSRASRRRSA